MNLSEDGEKPQLLNRTFLNQNQVRQKFLARIPLIQEVQVFFCRCRTQSFLGMVSGSRADFVAQTQHLQLTPTYGEINVTLRVHNLLDRSSLLLSESCLGRDPAAPKYWCCFGHPQGRREWCQLWCQAHEVPAATQSSIRRACRTCEITLDACVVATESEPLLLRALAVLLQHLRHKVLGCCSRTNAGTRDGDHPNDICGTKQVHKKCVQASCHPSRPLSHT